MVEVINQIRAAEEQADEIQKSARAQTRVLHDETVALGKQLLDEERQKAATQAADLTQKAEESAATYLGEQAEETAGMCDQLSAQAKSRMDKAAAFIVERIVERL